MEKPRVTEIHVRMDCNGCVQKIKKALHGINGIYELYIDFPQQKLTIIGWADPEKIVKAIKKTRKIATICSHTEQQTEPAPQPPEQAPENGAPAPEVANPPPAEAPPPSEAAPPAEAASPAEPPRESPPPQQPAPEPATPTPVAAETNPGQQIHHQRPRDVGEVHTIYHHDHHPPGQSPPPPQQPAPEPAARTPVAAETKPGQQIHHQRPRDVGEVHTIYHQGHHPPDYGYSQGYNGYWNGYRNSQGPPSEPAPITTPMGQSPMTAATMGPPPTSPTPAPMYVTHSYNTYRPSPYVTEYQYIQPPPQPTHLSRTNHYNEHFRRTNHYEEQHYVNGNGNGNGNGNITSIFSDENPNACTVM